MIADPPYFKVKNEWWDRQWDNPESFLSWIGELCEEWRRVLRPNGSLYVFASPKMAARVEVSVSEWFNVLNRVRWQKDAGWHRKTRPADLRCFLSPWEEIIFAEHYNSDNIAKGEAGYVAKCDELRGFVFEPLRAYLARERDRSGISNTEINHAWCAWKGVSSTSQTQKWFSSSCFNPPTKEAYQWLRSLTGPGFFERDHEDLRREYEDLRREYEDLRRPFNVSADAPYTDAWTFPTVQHYPGKHPCEKPVDLLRHIVSVSSREEDLVLDPFCGSGSSGEAALSLGRRFFGMDIDPHWARVSANRIGAATQQPLPLAGSG